MVDNPQTREQTANTAVAVWLDAKASWNAASALDADKPIFTVQFVSGADNARIWPDKPLPAACGAGTNGTSPNLAVAAP